MSKVEMVYFGKRALVDADQVKKLQQKEMLVAQATDLANMAKAYPNLGADLELDKVMAKIVRLNRTIRQNVQFL